MAGTGRVTGRGIQYPSPPPAQNLFLGFFLPRTRYPVNGQNTRPVGSRQVGYPSGTSQIAISICHHFKQKTELIVGVQFLKLTNAGTMCLYSLRRSPRAGIDDYPHF